MIAWQRDIVGPGQQSITLIGYDPAGIAEAIGTLYDSASGLEPLMPLAPPRQAKVSPATRTGRLPELVTAWRVALPDRAVSMQAGGSDALSVMTADGSQFTIDPLGKVEPAHRCARCANRPEERRARFARCHRQGDATRIDRQASGHQERSRGRRILGRNRSHV